MRPRFLSVVLCLPLIATGQAQRCRVLDAQTGEPLAYAVFVNGRSGIRSLADSIGFATIAGVPGDRLRFSSLGHQPLVVTLPVSERCTVRLLPEAIGLSGVEVLSPLGRYRRDSALNHSFFRKELADAKFQPKAKLYGYKGGPMGIQFGVKWDGLFSNLALHASGKKRRYHRLARTLREHDRIAFSVVRYNPSVVSRLTGLDEDSAALFITAHPFSDEFLRRASELELYSQIRSVYRDARKPVSVGR